MEADENDRLTPASATQYRALSARINCLSQDRPDVSFAAKELCRDFAAPTTQSWQRLKRVARYLVANPRLVYKYRWQYTPKHLQLFVDTDFAGCRVSRRSTSGGAAMFGQHCLKHWSSTQATLALSSGEAEITGLCKGADMGIGLRSVGDDLGIKHDIEILSDATAALGIARRLGIGKIRNLDVSLLWIQQKVREKDLTLTKVPGKSNPGYSFTKYLSGPEIQEHLRRMNLQLESGRASTAPTLT